MDHESYVSMMELEVLKKLKEPHKLISFFNSKFLCTTIKRKPPGTLELDEEVCNSDAIDLRLITLCSEYTNYNFFVVADEIGIHVCTDEIKRDRCILQ